MEIRRKPNESTGALLRRFSRLIQQSHILINAKNRRYFQKKLTERQERRRAIMGNSLGQLRKKLTRLGKYDNETFSVEKKKLKQNLTI